MKLFNTSTLRKIRDRLISVLKKANYKLETHYKLNAVNQLVTSFKMTLVFKSATDQAIASRMSKIKEVLAESDELFDLVVTTVDKTVLQIDVSSVYERINVPKPEDPSENGEDRDTRHTFLKQVQSTVSERIFHGKEFEGKAIKHDGNKEVAELIVPLENIYAIVDHFTSKGFKCFCTSEQHVLVFKDSSDTTVKHDEYLSFLARYKSAEQMMNFLEELIIKILHYVGLPSKQVATRTYISEIALNGSKGIFKVEIGDSENANFLAKVLNELPVSAEKIGNVLYVTVDTQKLSVAEIEKRWEHYKSKPQVKKKGFVVETQIKNGQEVHMVPRLSHDYSQFHYLPFNRKIIQAHVQDLRQSIREFGFLDFVIVARTDVVDGKTKDWIVDRQHRFEALKADKRPIPYAIIHVHTKYELVRLIAALNSKSRKWQARDYLHAWSTLKMEEYDIINEWKTKLSIMLIVQCMTGLEPKAITEKFQQGSIQFKDVEKGKIIMQELLQIEPYLPRGIRYKYATVKFLYRIREKTENFSVGKLLEGILKYDLAFDPNDRDQQIIEMLEERYFTN